MCTARVSPPETVYSFNVTVITMDTHDAGTDATVSIAMYGTDANCPEITLSASTGSFQPGS